MQFQDRRSKKIVFTSHCIININNKFPGYADVKGAYTKFIIPILEAGVGIFQMPCPEVLGWGGVDRKRIEFDLDRENLDQDWIKEYPEQCARWARWTADRYQDYVESGYDVLGIIHIGNSPTCGLDGVDEFPQVHFDLLDSGVSWDNLVFDNLVQRAETPEQLRARGATGKGAFANVLREELNERGYAPPWIPYVISKPMAEQAELILTTLGISNGKDRG